MHVVVPTLDLVTMLSKLRPMRSLVTSGFQFAVYTLEAYQGKLRMIVGDKSSITASTEVFADVKQEGKLSINGTDFYESMARIVPDSKSQVAGSKEITLKGSNTKLNLSTVTYYNKIDAKIPQRRTFGRVTQDLNLNDRDKPKDFHIKIKTRHLSEIFKVSNRLISSYTSDMAGLAGILLRIKDNKLMSVVSDGMRILEVTYPLTVQSEDFDVIIPKVASSMLQVLIEEGDEVDIYADSRKIKFYINSDGLKTYLASNLVRAQFPHYDPVFEASGTEFLIDNKLFSDNISNIRKSLNDETYRVRMIFDGTNLSLENTKSSSHLQFSNAGLPVTEAQGQPFDILVNAFLLEGLLSLFKSENVGIVSPPDNKPMIIKNDGEDIKVRAAIALATE